MENPEISSKTRFYSRLAGLLFLFFTLVSILHYSLIDANILGNGNISEAITFIRSNEVLFRSGIVLDLILFTSGIVLAVTLYLLVEQANKYLAHLSFIFFIIQMILLIVIESTSYILIFLVKDEVYSGLISKDELYAIIDLVLNARSAIYTLSILMSPGMMLYIFLLFKSALIPGVLAGWGIISFLLMVTGTTIHIISPVDIPVIRAIILGSSSSAILFQIFLGIWLIARKNKIIK